jgi:ankyrin repeat protein
MSEVDPDTLLEWLQIGHNDVTLLALEQLCTILLLSDNIDRCFESYPPRSFLPALCKIFLDELASDSVLEATARAITYYLDVSQECTRRIVAVDGTLRAICNRLLVIEVDNKTSKDLAEQCIKSLELICARESAAVFEAGGLNCILPFILEHGKVIYKDTLHSAMSVVTRLCGKMEPNDPSLDFCVETLSKLLKHEDNFVADGALRCFASLSDRFTRKGVDPAPLSKYGLVEELIRKLGDSITISNANKWASSSTSASNNAQQQQLQLSITTSANENASKSTTVVSVSTLTSLLSTLCRASHKITKEILESNILDSIEKAMYSDERCVLDTMRFLDLLLTLIFEGRDALPKTSSKGSFQQTQQPQSQFQQQLTQTISPAITNSTSSTVSATSFKSKRITDPVMDKLHRHSIESIRNRDTEALIESLETNQVDINFMDDVGQTLLNWAAAFGTAEMVEYLAAKGADVNKGLRSSSLHYAACFGRVNIVKILLAHGANPELRDEEGKTPLDKARERSEESHREVVQLLQSPGDFINSTSVTTGLLASASSSTNTNTINICDDNNNDDNNEKNNSNSNNNDNNNNSNNLSIEKEQQQNQQQQQKINNFDSNQNSDQQQPQEESSQHLNELNTESKINNLNDIKMNYTKRLIPILCKLYFNCMIQSINKACLNILRKLISYSSKDQLDQIVQMHLKEINSISLSINNSATAASQTSTTLAVYDDSQCVSTLLVELVAKILQDYENFESILIALSISSELFKKCSPYILEEFNRLGVASLISDLASDTSLEDDKAEESFASINENFGTEKRINDLSAEKNLNSDAPVTSPIDNSVASNATSQQPKQLDVERAYMWNNEWCLLYTKEFIYLFNKDCVLELSHNSNGWFRFLINDRLYSMYSNGQPETGADIDENKPILINKLAKARQTCLEKGPIKILFAEKKETEINEIKFDNWLIKLVNEHELKISNIYANQKTVLRQGVRGFEFESNRNELHTFVAEQMLTGNEFEIPQAVVSSIDEEDEEKIAENGPQQPPTPPTSTKSKLEKLKTTTNISATSNFKQLTNITTPHSGISSFSNASSTTAKLNALQQYLAAANAKSTKAKQKQLKESVHKLALKLNHDYLQQVQNQPRSLALKLITLVGKMKNACEIHDCLDDLSSSTIEWRHCYEEALNELKQVLAETNKSISSYELSISGLVQTMLMALCPLSEHYENSKLVKIYERIRIFCKVFSLTKDSNDQEKENASLILTLLHKLIALLESIEKLPIYLYDAPGSYNMQVFTKRFKLTLSRGEQEPNFLDFSGRVLKVEPLANVSHLEKYIAKMVVKQWYDYERSTLNFIKSLEGKLPYDFKYHSDFDENGLIYWIGTNGKARPDWCNPSSHNSLVKLSISDSKSTLAYGQIDELIGRIPSNTHSSDDKRTWFVVDLGAYIIPTHYTLRYSKGFAKTAPRNWVFLMSKTGGPNLHDWDILYTHVNDETLKEHGQSATWSLSECEMIKKELQMLTGGK